VLRSSQVKFNSDQVRSDHGQLNVRSKSCKIMPGQNGSDHVKFMFGQLKSGWVRAWLGQIKSDQIR